MSGPTLIATHTGLRGRPGEGLTGEVVADAVRRFAAELGRRGLPPTIAVGRDERPSGRELTATIVGLARDAGLDVTDLGVVATPTAKLAARRRGLGGAIVVTASHLGGDWNGLKLVAAPDYLPVDSSTLPPPAPADRPARRGELRSDPDAAAEHADAACAAVGAEAIRAAGLAVSWTGGAGDAVRLALERLGCRRAEGAAEVGLVLDADGDRLRLVDEAGRALDEEATLALVALARGARSVVKGADTSTIVDELVPGPVHVVAPGELNLARALLDLDADVAGEGNGGVIVPEVGPARDGLAAAVAVLELLARSGRRLSELAGDLPRRAIRRSALPVTSEHDVRRALEAVAAWAGVAAGEPFAGVSVARPGGAWGLVRLSATEPVLRVTAEAATDEEVERLHAELREAVAEASTA